MQAPTALLPFFLGSLLWVPGLAQTSQPANGPAPPDPAIASFRTDLLDVSFRAVSKLPEKPHIKNRSRAQEQVVETALELGLPRLAATYAVQIENWRSASALAAIAEYWIRAGELDEARAFMQRARIALDSVKDEESQGWRLSRVRAKLAACHLRLGEPELAMELRLGLDASETSVVEVALAELLAPESFDTRFELAKAVAASGDFEGVRTMLDTCTTLFSRFYDEPERRSKVLELIETAWKTLPVPVRLETNAELFTAARAHGDRAAAGKFLEAAEAMLESTPWAPDAYLPHLARLAKQYQRFGQPEVARARADAGLDLYRAQRERIVDMYRSRALCPLAEAYVELGRLDRANETYALAIEEAFVNPNGRPRAEDLAVICCSLARVGLVPDEALWTKIGLGLDQLRAPW